MHPEFDELQLASMFRRLSDMNAVADGFEAIHKDDADWKAAVSLFFAGGGLARADQSCPAYMIALMQFNGILASCVMDTANQALRLAEGSPERLAMDHAIGTFGVLVAVARAAIQIEIDHGAELGASQLEVEIKAEAEQMADFKWPTKL